MKKRYSHVGNSSSSSFILGAKGELREILEKNFKLPENHPLAAFAKDIVDCLVSNVSEPMKTIVDVLEHWGYGEVTRARMQQFIPEIDLIKEGYTLYVGSVSDEWPRGEVDPWLCFADFDIKTDDFVFQKEGGY